MGIENYFFVRFGNIWWYIIKFFTFEGRSLLHCPV
ncbi:Protein of unknown function [Gryllus bimaculatus]|nr:Protein of unknown function [Gryllus bimaculatus]